MAKAEINKSAEIRSYYKQHPKAKPKQVQSGLKEQGIEVDTNMISTVRYNMRKKKGKGRRAASATAQPASKAKMRGNGRGNSLFDKLVGAKKLADQMGGIERARTALKMLEQLS